MDIWKLVPVYATTHTAPDTVLKGVSISLSSERTVIDKTWVTIPVFLADVGGFALVVYCVFAMFYKLMNVHTLEKYFINELYKQPTQETIDYKDKNDSPQHVLMSLAKISLNSRTKIPDSTFKLFDYLWQCHAKWCSQTTYKKNYNFMKAR